MTGKFIIKNILIEKSSKDIQTGKYHFCDNFNLICGDNEVGKSSLSEFIKNGFFKTQNVRSESGKIYFEYKNAQYTAEIPNTTKPPVIFDEYSQKCDENLLENALNKRYLEEGFTINLDDLNTLERKSYCFIEELKDPSNNKLNTYLNNLEKEFYTNVKNTAKETLKTTVSEIRTKEIASLNTRIKENSSAESNYIEALREKEAVELKIQNLEKRIKSLEILNYLKKTQTETNECAEDGLTFNVDGEVFGQNANTLKERIKTYNQNLKLIDNNSKNLLKKKNELAALEQKLIEDAELVCNANEFPEFKINNINNNNILAAEKELTKLKGEYEVLIGKLSVMENDLKKNEIKIRKIKSENKISGFSLVELKELNNILNTGLEQIADNDNKISVLMTENDNAKTINGKNSTVIATMSVTAILSFISSIYKFTQSDIISGSIFIIISLLSVIMIFFVKKTNLKEAGEYIDNLKTKQTAVYDNLKTKLSDYCPKIKDNKSNELLFELKNIKKSIDDEIKILTDINEADIEKNEKENEINKTKNELTKIQNETSKKETNIKELAYTPLFEKAKSVKCYIAATEILTQIQKYKDEIFDISKTIEKEQNENKEIINLIISETAVKIEEIKSTIENEDKSVEELKSEMNNLKKEKDEITKKTGEYSNVEYNIVLKNKKNALEEKYKNIIKSVCTKKIAIEIIKNAKIKFNKTQPNVISAEKYLSLLTGGKYSKIDLDGNKIANEEETVYKEWENLSRGTKEQLYLALRLGYASNYAKTNTNEPNGKPNLPLIIDDAFVNFDEKRTKNALKCLLEFSKTNQVLFFTCHNEEMKRLIKEITSDIEVKITEI